MNEQFEVIVESKPFPDGEGRLRRIFDVLLSPISNRDEEPDPVESYQVDLATDDTPDVATPAKTGLYKTVNLPYNKYGKKDKYGKQGKKSKKPSDAKRSRLWSNREEKDDGVTDAMAHRLEEAIRRARPK